MSKYYVHYYKTEDLSPDEESCRRRNQEGIWLDIGGVFAADSKREAVKQARAANGPGWETIKMRAVEK